MENIVCVNRTKEDWPKIKAFFENQGICTEGYSGDNCLEGDGEYPYYGVIDGEFECYGDEEIEDARVIIPPELPKRGDMVEVWDNNIPQERIFVSTVEGTYRPVLAVLKSDNEKFLSGELFTPVSWKYMRPIITEKHNYRGESKDHCEESKVWTVNLFDLFVTSEESACKAKTCDCLKSEPDNLKEGDEVIFRDEKHTIGWRHNNIVILIDQDGDAIGPFTIDELKNH